MKLASTLPSEPDVKIINLELETSKNSEFCGFIIGNESVASSITILPALSKVILPFANSPSPLPLNNKPPALALMWVSVMVNPPISPPSIRTFEAVSCPSALTLNLLADIISSVPV